MQIICGIYKIISPNGKIYIGQSENVYRRWVLYKGKYILNNNSKKSYPKILWRSLQKYGSQKHTFEIVEICDIDKLNEREIFWIDFYKTYNTRHGMNCTKGGEGVKGYKWSKKARLKQSLTHKGKKPWNKGIKPDEDAREKNRQAQIKRWQLAKQDPLYYSEEQINHRKKKDCTNLSAIRKKMWEKIKSSDKFTSVEERNKRSLAAKKREQNKRESGFKVSEETRRKRSVASKRLWEKRKQNLLLNQ